MGKYDALQNGSDVRGVALQLEGGPAVSLTGEAANCIAAAFAAWLAGRRGKPAAALKIGIGHDSRLTAAALKEQIASGCAGAGAQVFDCGLASTPAMFMGTVFEETAFDGSIMITASHLPKERNGMKFFTPGGGLDKGDIAEVLAAADALAPHPVPAAAAPAELMGLYARHLQGTIVRLAAMGGRPLEGLHIVVDAGNGAGGFFTRQVLEPLGANCAGSQYLEPDGSFPNHIPNPENKEAMQAIQRAVTQSKADLGIIFDTDVDRMSAVFEDGQAVNRDAIIALMSAILAPEYPGGTVVTDSVTSDGLTDFLEGRLGMKHCRFKRGYKNVINKAIELNVQGRLTPLAIETSGHGALNENYFLDDGAYMAVRIVAAAAQAGAEGRALASLLDGFVPPRHEAERRIGITARDFAACGGQALAAFEKNARDAGYALADSYEGVRLSLPGKGWLLLRMSLHDPVMPLNAEGKTPADLRKLLDIAGALLAGVPGLDLAALTAAE